ncbi:MAG: LysR family transcriptional regulator [Polyangiaceae bacterium]
MSLRAVEVFCAVVEEGSFSLAARRLGVTPAAVSRAIARHEGQLGAPLFRRTTRSVRLVAGARDYYAQCKRALELIESAEAAFGEDDPTPRGLVRISAPTTFGHSRLLPLLARFRELHASVDVELHLGNRNVDLVAEGFDLAIRMGELPDSSLVARKLCDATLGVFASPHYLALRGTPKRASELGEHAIIGFVRPSTGRVLPWLFEERKRPFEWHPPKALRISDDFNGCVTLACAGGGLVQAYHFLVAAHVDAGRLVEVLPSLAGRSRPFHLVSPPGGSSKAARALAAAIVDDAAALSATRPEAKSRKR